MKPFDLKHSLNPLHIQLHILAYLKLTAIGSEPAYLIRVMGGRAVGVGYQIGFSGRDGVAFNRVTPSGFAFMPVTVIVLVTLRDYAVR